MEGTQKPKKRKSSAWVAVLTVAALFCVARPTLAQFPQVAPNGVGDLLIYHLWITSDPTDPRGTTGTPRDTLIALMHPFGGQNQFVHFRIREGVGSDDVRDFTICLSPGDVWTAAISPRGIAGQSQIVVANPGSCDSQVAGNFTPPPAPGVAVPIQASFGYIEAFTLRDPASPPGPNNVGDDVIMGIATVVNVEAGFSSSWNALAVVGFDGVNEGSTTFRNSAIAQAIAREGGVDKEVLLTRWTADPDIASETQIVLTFPGGFQPGPTDRVSIWLFDEDENFNFSPREIILPWEVNFCNFSVNDATGFAEFACQGGAADPLEIVAPTDTGTIHSGWARIINNALGNDEFDNIDAPPVSRFPVTGVVFSAFENVEDDYDQAYGLQWAAIRGVGGVGGANCAGTAPTTTCLGYNLAGNLAGQFAPWFPAVGPGVTPGDNVTGALNRTGTTGP